MAGKPKITAAVFASGSGSNAENILRFAQENPDKISIPVVICNKEGAGVIGRCERLGVKCEVIPLVREGYVNFTEAKKAQEKRVLKVLENYDADWALLAGYMFLFTPDFLPRFSDGKGGYRIVNVHPALLPAFPGKDPYGDAWKAGVKESGVTIHYADEGMDSGPIVMQRKFPRLESDTFEDFRARGMQVEYQIYREFLQQLIEGKVA